MSDHNINVNFNDSKDNNGANSGIIKDAFYRNTASIANLNKGIEKLGGVFNDVGKQLLKNDAKSTKNLSDFLNKIDNSLKQINQNLNKNLTDKPIREKKAKDEEFNKSIYSTMGTVLATAFGVTAMRLINNVANQSLNQAKIIGGFLSSGIRGQADQTFSQYVGNIYSNQKNYQQAFNKITAQGIGGGLGGLLGVVSGGLIGKTPSGASTGAKIGGAIGGVAGDYFASMKNAPIEQKMAIIGAIKQREAEASLLQYRAGFSRFGLPMSNVQLAPKEFTGGKSITTPLSLDFERNYGYTKSGMPNPNYNAILSLVPYLKTNPLDKTQTGDLNQTVMNFNKAGIAMQDYTKTVIQANLYQSLTNKNIQEYSNMYRKAVVKYGEDYNLGTQQTSLNLMALGITQSEAQRLSFQSQYNPSVMSNVSRYMHQGVGDWYKNKALGDMTGIDINRSLMTGTLQGQPNKIKQLKDEYSQMINNKTDPMSLPLLSTLWASGTFDLAQIAGLKQPQVLSKIKGIDTGQAGYSPAQEQYITDIKGILANGTISVTDMSVTAGVVNIVNNNGGSGGSLSNYMTGLNYFNQAFAPTPFTGDRSPAKK